MQFKQVGLQTKCHARVIWDCAWHSSSLLFATASRDKTVKIWQQIEDTWKCIDMLKFNESCTSCDFAPLSDQYS